ncbi:ABC transporter ATP-binding protein [Kibdelosporangium phytohabitans]|uniref:ABC transporter ATP-binding protein n=1 Tax=Kibdelosporangium phytohabitans TaxID=860235 RepID=UPI000AB1C103|nr:ABC transporter ATP-binding protein [Kibdelosporangium phytohabitans]
MRGIVKRFPGVLANDHVDLDVGAGEVHALMGENGAGKSTLMSILYGLCRPDSGTVALGGEPVGFDSPAQAIEAGVGMVQQEFALFPQLTVAENVVFGREPTRAGLLDRRAAVRVVDELIARHDLRVRPGDRVGDLPVGLRQQVEILKLLYRSADVLILDEPTAVLTPAETERLFGVLRALADEGRTVLFVSHKLHEILAVSDQVTVMRDGKVSAHGPAAEFTPHSLASAMTGREIDLDRVHPPGTPGEPVLELPELTVRAGEIVGIAGVAGNGQNVLVSRITGAAHVPEERGETGSAASASVADNLAVGFHRRGPLLRGGLLRPSEMRKHARAIIERFDVRATERQPMGTLSGGNQQKAILGRELTHDSPLLVVEQPTRGVDVGAIENIHARLVAYRDAGHGILLVSSELSEILALSDRILVMYEGRITAEFSRADADPDRIGLAMAGGVL